MNAMKNLSWSLYLVSIVMAVAFCLGKCTRDLRTSDDPWDAEPALNFYGGAPIEDVPAEEKFVACAVGLWQFGCPIGWLVEYNGAGGVEHISIASTDKKIVRGAVLPDDYFYENGDAIGPDIGKYATDYVLITLDIYPDDAKKDWPSIFAEIYPGAVNAFEPYQVPYQPDLAAMRPLELSAVVDGQIRFVARGGERIYDVALHYRGVADDAAEVWFNEFLQRFPFFGEVTP